MIKYLKKSIPITAEQEKVIKRVAHKPLTEQEYIQSCNMEQLAEWIAKQKCDGCSDNPYDEKHGTCKYCMAKKTEQVREWLKQPHMQSEKRAKLS